MQIPLKGAQRQGDFMDTSIIYRETVLNRFVYKCEEKNVMANEIVGVGALNFFLIILSELVVKCVIGYFNLLEF